MRCTRFENPWIWPLPYPAKPVWKLRRRGRSPSDADSDNAERRFLRIGDREQEYFADRMVERTSGFFVIARNSSFTYKGRAIDVKQVGRELGVRYVLEGSVRKAGGRVRIAAQLIDALNGVHLWADRFDGSLEDVFELQARVASSVAGVIEPALQAAEIARSANRPTSGASLTRTNGSAANPCGRKPTPNVVKFHGG